LDLSVNYVSKSYSTPRGELPILENVSLTLKRGDAAAIMGPSGSGKSTLLYTLGILDPPTSGTVTLDGTDAYKLGERAQAAFRNQHIGFVFQDHSLLPQCSVLENVLTPTLVAPARERSGKGEGAESDEARARDILGRVGLSDRLDHRPGELSGGEKQRAAIARALIRRPTLLLCDEPTGNLDASIADSVASVLLDLHTSAQTILVVVTHSAHLASRFPIRYEMRDRGLHPVS
jgi:lipoprotein-releasing system ATP-binding protein